MQTNVHRSGQMKQPMTRTKADEFRKAGRLDDAVSEYRQLWPDEDLWTGWGYAYCLRKLGRSQEALAVAREVYALDPEFVFGRSIYAWSLYDVHIRGVDAPNPEVLKAAQMIVRLTRSSDMPYAPTSALARIMHEGSDFGIDTKASAWYKCFVYRHLPTTEALA